MTSNSGKNSETFEDLAQIMSSYNNDINDVPFFPPQLQKSNPGQTSVHGSIVDETKTEKISQPITLEPSSTTEQGSQQNSNDSFINKYSTYLWAIAAGLTFVVGVPIIYFMDTLLQANIRNFQENPPLKLIDQIRKWLTDRDHVPHNPRGPHSPHFGFDGESFIAPAIAEGNSVSSNAAILNTVQASLGEPGTERLQAADNVLMSLLTSANTPTSVAHIAPSLDTSSTSPVEMPAIFPLTPESGALISAHPQHTNSYYFVIPPTDITEVSSIQSITTQGQLVPLHGQAAQESTSNSQSNQLTEYSPDVITATIYGGPDYEPQIFTATPSQLISFLHSPQTLQLWDSLMNSGSAVALIYHDTICLYLFPYNETPIPQALMICALAEEQYL